MHLRFCFLLVLAGATWLAAADPNVGYRLHSRFWLEYESDKDTLGLFHLDKNRKLDDKVVDAALESALKDDAGEILDRGDQTEQGGNVQDGSHHRRNARTAGDCVWTDTGRLGGALQLKGGKSVVVTPQYADLNGGKAWTAEGWFCPEGEGDSVLIAADAKGQAEPAFAVWRLTDGRLRITVAGKTTAETPTPRSARGQWRHVALLVVPAHEVNENWVMKMIPPTVHVRLDGEELLAPAVPEVPRLLQALTGAVYFGNRPGGAAPFVGQVDELRVSGEARIYYFLDTTTPDPEQKRKLAVGAPYLRDAQDLALYLPFNGAVEPTTAAPGTTATLVPWTRPKNPEARPVASFLPGVYGQALVLGPESAMPSYAAAGNLQAASGSLECWFQPRSWDNRRFQGFQDPMEYVSLLRVQATVQEKTRDFLQIGFFHKQPMEAARPRGLYPGSWYHVICTWDEDRKVQDGKEEIVRRQAIYLNGRPVPPSTVYCHRAALPAEATISRILFDPVAPLSSGEWQVKETLVDEVRVYRRALTPEETANAYQRYLPQPKLTKLPFAHVDLTMNCPERWADVAIELLDERRDQVAGVAVSLFGPDNQAIAPVFTLKPANGRAACRAADVAATYGAHRAVFEFRNAAAQPIDTMNLDHPRPRPPWLGSRVGIHEDEVLPEWEPLVVHEQDRISMILRDVQMDPRGWPAHLVSRGKDVLAAPPRVVLKAGGAEVVLAPAAGDAKSVVREATKTHVETSGEAAGGDWKMTTAMHLEYDGLMKFTTTLSGPPGGSVDELRLEFPLRPEHATFLGFWTGEQNFRWATDYRLLPANDGVLFESREPGRGTSARLKGSFIPYVFLGDDLRGLAWFAENDRGWSWSERPPPAANQKDAEAWRRYQEALTKWRQTTVSAVQVLRQGQETVLRLNLITRPTPLKQPRTFVFGLHLTPVKPLPAGHRALAARTSFGWCDSFSKQQLKSDDHNKGNFQIYPDDYDWEGAARRAKMHAFHYGADFGYPGPLLYTDRNWVGLPPDSWEYSGRWYSSGFYRYLPEAANCYLWNMNEWLKRKLIAGMYIDDVWIGTVGDPATGLAYRAEDGTIQPGFEFFDYHGYLKRLRWLYHDNGVKPFIWLHMTHTPYAPCIAFADFGLDGEDRFLGWGSPADFMVMWPVDRIRFGNGEKLGIIPLWMNKIGNDQKPKPMGIEHWEFRQARSYCGSLLMHDVSDNGYALGGLQEFRKAMIQAGPQGRFRGYWEGESPLVFAEPGLYTSLYLTPTQTFAVIANYTPKAAEYAATVYPERFGLAGLTRDNVVFLDADEWSAPAGEDVTQMKKPEITNPDAPEKDELDTMFSAAVKDGERDELKAKGIVIFDDHNFEWKEGKLKLRLRGHNFRLLEVQRKP